MLDLPVLRVGAVPFKNISSIMKEISSGVWTSDPSFEDVTSWEWRVDGVVVSTSRDVGTITVSTPGVKEIQLNAYGPWGRVYASEKYFFLPQPPQIVTDNLPTAGVGMPYTVQLEAHGYGTLSWSSLVLEPSLNGIELTTSGILQGVPSEVGTYTVTVTVTDEFGQSDTRTLTLPLTVESIGPEIITEYFPDAYYSAPPPVGKPVFMYGAQTGRTGFGSIAVLNDGTMVFSPVNCPVIGRYDPSTDTYWDGPPHGQQIGETFPGSIHNSDDTVLFLNNFTINTVLYTPGPETLSTLRVSPWWWERPYSFGLQMPDGRSIILPYNSTTIDFYDPTTRTIVQGPVHGKGQSPWSMGLILPNNKVLLASDKCGFFSIFNPSTNSIEIDYPWPYSSPSGMLLREDGKVLLSPRNWWPNDRWGGNFHTFDYLTGTITKLNAWQECWVAPLFFIGTMANKMVIIADATEGAVEYYNPYTDTIVTGNDSPTRWGWISAALTVDKKRLIMAPNVDSKIGILFITEYF